MAGTPEDKGTASAWHSVWGRVLDPRGEPVSNAEVFWISAEHEGEDSVELFHVHKVAQADPDGRFWAAGLPAGRSLLLPDFQRMGRSGDRFRIGHATTLNLPLAEDVGELVLEFPFRRTDFGSVHGVVRDIVDQRPIPDLPVALFDESGKKAVRTGQTGPDGSFGFELLPAGKYHLVIMGTPTHLEGTAPLTLGLNQRLDAKIGQHRRPDGPRGSLVVRVEDPLGLPVPGAVVSMMTPNFHVAPKEVDSGGLAHIDGLPVRPNAVLAAAPGFWQQGVALPPGGLTDPAEVRVVLPRSVAMRIFARDAVTGKPVRHANILVTHSGGDQWIWGGVLPPPDAPSQSFHEVQVSPGPVTIRGESPGYRTTTVEREVASSDDPLSVRLDLA
jgi:hypothetical protein